MAQLAEGERAAFDRVFATLWPLLRRFCARLLGDEAAGEDAAQAALCRIFSRATEWTCGRDVVAWALGIAAWECKTVRQKSKRRREAPEQDSAAAPAGGPSPEEEAEMSELRKAVLEELVTLPATDIETLEALASGERPAIPGPTFRKRAQRALTRLRAAWRSTHGAG